MGAFVKACCGLNQNEECNLAACSINAMALGGRVILISEQKILAMPVSAEGSQGSGEMSTEQRASAERGVVQVKT